MSLNVSLHITILLNKKNISIFLIFAKFIERVLFLIYLHNQLGMDIQILIEVQIVSFGINFLGFEIRRHLDIKNLCMKFELGPPGSE